MADKDTEITLGTGKLLGLFFGIVIICAGFFGAGFSLGKNSAPTATLPENVPAPVSASTTAKPSPVKTAATKPDCSTAPETCAPATSSDTTLPKTDPGTQPPVAVTPPAAPVTNVPDPKTAPTPDVAKPRPAAAYIVQVAAVSKQQDAEALASALRKKNYAVTVTMPISDNLFRVQVGPFADAKEAESARTRLLSDGYNPIVKR